MQVSVTFRPRFNPPRLSGPMSLEVLRSSSADLDGPSTATWSWAWKIPAPRGRFPRRGNGRMVRAENSDMSPRHRPGNGQIDMQLRKQRKLRDVKVDRSRTVARRNPRRRTAPHPPPQVEVRALGAGRRRGSVLQPKEMPFSSTPMSTPGPSLSLFPPADGGLALAGDPERYPV